MESKDLFLHDNTYMKIHSDIYHLCADVGLRRPEGFPHHRWRGRGDDITGVDAE